MASTRRPKQPPRGPGGRGRPTARGVTARVKDLPPPQREEAVEVLKDSFVGYYRWHAKRTLRDVERVRVIRADGEIVAVSMFERFFPEVGYLNYVAVARTHRRRGYARRLLEDALRQLRTAGVEVVFAAASRSNRASLALLASRGFRTTRRKERGWQEGGLGAWGLRSRMHVIRGEVVLALRLRPRRTGPATLPRKAGEGSGRARAHL